MEIDAQRARRFSRLGPLPQLKLVPLTQGAPAENHRCFGSMLIRGRWSHLTKADPRSGRYPSTEGSGGALSTSISDVLFFGCLGGLIAGVVMSAAILVAG